MRSRKRKAPSIARSLRCRLSLRYLCREGVLELSPAQLVELSQAELPLLFLLDEILSGTNSHDRRIGAAAVIKSLVARGALGLVTTHDLALTKIAEELNGRARNVHFQDELKDDQMYFDYRMHDGVVERSNALELMRAVGLDV